MKLPPLKMRPAFLPRPWGGMLMKDLLGKDIPDGAVGESWPHFAIGQANVDGEVRLSQGRACRAGTVVRGRGAIAWEGGDSPLETGDSFVLPRETEGTRLRGACTVTVTEIR